MKTRIKKRRNFLYNRIRILVYFNNKKNADKIRWFSATRILVLLWNIITLLYHILIIKMTSVSGIGQHIIGMFIEYLISGIYENSIVRMNKFINIKTTHNKNKKLVRYLLKYIAFGFIFSLIYTVVYILRMLVLYSIGWGLVYWDQTKMAIINGILFGIIVGPFVGFLASAARDKKLKIKIIKNQKESLTS